MIGLEINPSVEIFLDSMGDYTFYGHDCILEGEVATDGLFIEHLFAHLGGLDGFWGIGVWVIVDGPYRMLFIARKWYV